MSELVASKNYNIKADILNKYKFDSISTAKHNASAYSYSELNTMSYNILSLKKYSNLHYDKTKAFIILDITLNKSYNEVIICNKLL